MSTAPSFTVEVPSDRPARKTLVIERNPETDRSVVVTVPTDGNDRKTVCNWFA